MTKEQARAILKLHNGFTIADVRRAFVAACNACHPDKGNTTGDLDDIVQARDLLLANALGDLTCNQCKGNGYIRGKIGVYDCGRCGGTGTV